MRVLFTCELFPPDFAGGGEYILLEMARGLAGRGVDVRVLTTGDPAVTQFEGVPTVRLPISRYRFNLTYRQVALYARDADLIQTSFYHGCIPSVRAAKNLKKPVVGLVLGLFQEAWHEMKPWPMGQMFPAIEKLILKLDYQKLIFLSDFSCKDGLRLGVPPERAVVIPPAIELDAYHPIVPKRDVVFFSAKLDVRKGIYDLLAVAKALPYIRFCVMGWGPDEARVRALAPANVEFLPFEMGMPGDSLRKAYGEARIFFFPSKSETFGLSILEAMASGCAVVSSIPLHFEGIRVRAGDREGMIAALTNLWTDRELTSKMGRRNCELARQFTWENATDRLLAVYESILS